MAVQLQLQLHDGVRLHAARRLAGRAAVLLSVKGEVKRLSLRHARYGRRRRRSDPGLSFLRLLALLRVDQLRHAVCRLSVLSRLHPGCDAGLYNFGFPAALGAGLPASQTRHEPILLDNA
jgi:hypothetical protein